MIPPRVPSQMTSSGICSPATSADDNGGDHLPSSPLPIIWWVQMILFLGYLIILCGCCSSFFCRPSCPPWGEASLRWQLIMRVWAIPGTRNSLQSAMVLLIMRDWAGWGQVFLALLGFEESNLDKEIWPGLTSKPRRHAFLGWLGLKIQTEREWERERELVFQDQT